MITKRIIPGRVSRRAALRALSGLGVGGATLWAPGCGDATKGNSGSGGAGGGSSEVPTGLSKQPYVQVVGSGALRLRFETRFDAEVPVEVTKGGATSTLVPTRLPADVTYVRDFLEDPQFFPDEGGLHVVHDLVIQDLAPGETLSYRVDLGDEGVVEGSTRVSPTRGTSFRFGWLADTSWPLTEPTVAALSAAAPDLVLHGGDIQYQASPLDTWTGMSLSMAPLTLRAATHFIVGNHEFEDQDEIQQMYERLYLGQGDAQPGGPERYFALTYGGVRFIALDSESGGLEDSGGVQASWLRAELEATAANPDLAYAIVGMHRPLYSLSKHFPDDITVREVLHPMFLEFGVSLVLFGHAHCYEHFLVDGIHYVVDGGGGALLYDPDEDLAKADELRPGESDLRVASAKTHGAVVVDVQENGDLAVRRLDADHGGETDSFTIAVPGG